MSCREERILAAIAARLVAIPGTVAGDVAIDPPDEHGDNASFTRFAILPGDVAPAGAFNRSHGKVSLPVTIRGLADGALPMPGLDDVAASERSAGYALWRQMMPALWPSSQGIAYDDDLGGLCSSIAYAGHAIYPRDDGGKFTGVYIDCIVEYVLHLSNPDK